MICFLHNPKTAGQSFISLLKKNYSSDELYAVSNHLISGLEKEIISLPKERGEKIKLLYGHMEFGIHEFFPGQKIRYFTFLRDPVRRIISHYNYVKNKPEHELYALIHKYNMSIEDYVTSGISLELNNGQTRLITAQFDIQNNPSVAKYGSNDNEMLEKAKMNIANHFDFIGLQEYFSESVSYLRNLYGWKRYADPELNKGIYDSRDISPKTISLIERCNMIDIQLYKYILDSFGEKVISADKHWIKNFLSNFF